MGIPSFPQMPIREVPCAPTEQEERGSLFQGYIQNAEGEKKEIVTL